MSPRQLPHSGASKSQKSTSNQQTTDGHQATGEQQAAPTGMRENRGETPILLQNPILCGRSRHLHPVYSPAAQVYLPPPAGT